MLDRFTAENKVDEAGNPAGGYVRGTGLSVEWQNGPLGRGDDRTCLNCGFYFPESQKPISGERDISDPDRRKGPRKEST